MLRRTPTFARYQTAWRELLHPLPVKARQAQWLKRDQTEINQHLLKQPYYTIKSYSPPSGMLFEHNIDKKNEYQVKGFEHAKFFEREENRNSPQNSDFGVRRQLLAPRHANSKQKLNELRESLQFSSSSSIHVGPQNNNINHYKEEYGERVLPRYPESWETVPPHSPSAGLQ
ncbi:hypothetical protein AGDE_01784 [Angomonas deanei]|uniref:Uncharacterized protein n=1 Tax=Angomonas deanei TaxID=59799 RepID=A0A7G2CTQ1_9TRYP|nr:hypothetical protein AGDE_01784 [Angomonas deanei]CAD2222441.1 hypothetical protein, conserved [Angomonas deanei]|eukprot:EPY42139.1 hypothetical protein AGDE_01784 [Angomonas deanei]